MLDNETIYKRARFYTLELYEEIEAEQQSYFNEYGQVSDVLDRIMQKYAKEIEYLEILELSIEMEENKQGA